MDARVTVRIAAVVLAAALGAQPRAQDVTAGARPVAPARVSSPAPTARWEVVSVKPSGAGTQFPTVSVLNPSRFSARNISLARLLAYAYELRDAEQVVGGPEWMRSQAFDIAATTDGTPALSQVAAMMRTLLAERFAVQAHVETRDGPVYALRVARRDGALGPNLRWTAVDCAALMSSSPGGRIEGELCTGRVSLAGRIRTLRASALPIAHLAAMLATATGRDVIDRTDLTGTFDAELEWAPDTLTDPGPAGGPVAASAAVSVFTAVREQLGLTLESERGLMKVLVVDSVEQPAPD